MNQRDFGTTSLAAAVAASFPASQTVAAVLNAFTRVSADVNAVLGDDAEIATAFWHRYAEHNMLLTVSWKIDTDRTERIRWLRDYWAMLEPHTYGVYTNDLHQSNLRQYTNYRDNLERLTTLKNQYDPGILFRLNANIPPSV